MLRTMPGAPPKIPQGLIIVIWIGIALLLVLAALIELARGFHESFNGLISGW
jgi:hypothetical protein